MSAFHPGRVWAAMIAAAPARTWLTAGAGMAWTLASGALVWLFHGKLPPLYGLIIIESALFIVLVAIAALTGTEVSFRAGRDGVSGNLGQDVNTVPPAAPAERSLEAPP